MAKKEVNFFYYKIFVKNENREIQAIQTLFTKKDLTTNKIEINGENNIHYNCEFEEIEDGFFYGQIIRSRNNLEYSTLIKGATQWKSLHKEIGDGKTSENGLDRINFIIGPYNNELIILIEVGFQSPGAKVLTKFFQELLKGKQLNVNYKQVVTENAKQLLKKMLTKDKVESITFRPKGSEVDIPRGKNYPIVRSLKKLAYEGFDIILEIRLNKRKKGHEKIKKTVEDFLRNLFNIGPEKEVIDAIEELDLPEIFSKISVATEGDSGKITKSENILEKLEHQSITIDKSVIKMQKKLIEVLVEELKEKINELNREVEKNE